MAWDEVEAKKSTEQATQELQVMIGKFNAEQMKAAQQIRTWMLKWYNGFKSQDGVQHHATGWKALCYAIREALK